MKIITQRFILLISFIILIMLLCTPPHNPFKDVDSVDLFIEVPKKPDGFNYCVNDEVRFNVTVKLPNLVKKISIHFDEIGDEDEREITTNESKNEKISFEVQAQGNPGINYQWKKNGLIDVGLNSNEYKFNISSDDDGATFLCVVSNSELMVKSEEVKLTVLYKVAYDKKGGKGSAEPNTYAVGVTFNLPEDLTKDNHIFHGWSINEDGIADFNSGQEYTMGSKSITIYAVWKEKAYTITIDGVTYREIKIGNQIWMDKDFRKTSGILRVQDATWSGMKDPAYCINPENNALLFNWFAVSSDNFAPEGWAVPNNNDWSILADALRGSSENRSKFNIQAT